MFDKEDELLHLFKRIKTAHEFYIKVSEVDKERILNAMEDTVAALAAYGIDKSFGVLYILYGDEFTKFEFGKTLEEVISLL